MLESLSVIAAAMVGGLIWIMLPEHWQGWLFIAFLVLVAYGIASWLL